MNAFFLIRWIFCEVSYFLFKYFPELHFLSKCKLILLNMITYLLVEKFRDQN